MAKRIAQLVEVVEQNRQKCKRPVRAARPPDRLADALVEQGPVR